MPSDFESGYPVDVRPPASASIATTTVAAAVQAATAFLFEANNRTHEKLVNKITEQYETMLDMIGAQSDAALEAIRHNNDAVLQTVQQQNDEIARLNHMVGDIVCQSSRVAPEEFAPVIAKVNATWTTYESAPRDQRTALAVLHGLAERSTWLDLSRTAMVFFQRQLRRLEQRQLNGSQIENEATRAGLPVCDSEETVTALRGNFGYVDTIEDQQARIMLLDDEDRNVEADLWIPVNWLPRFYREEGAGVAWIERTYASGVKGRFEPASSRE